MVDREDSEPIASVELHRSDLDNLERIQKLMGHPHWLDTVKIALQTYDFLTSKNMGPGALHLGVMSIDGTPSESMIIDLK